MGAFLIPEFSDDPSRIKPPNIESPILGNILSAAFLGYIVELLVNKSDIDVYRKLNKLGAVILIIHAAHIVIEQWNAPSSDSIIGISMAVSYLLGILVSDLVYKRPNIAEKK